MSLHNKVLISGSNGFVGKHLTKALKKKGFEVMGIPRDIYYEPIKLSQLFEKEKPDYIFHLAAYGNMAQQTEFIHMIQANILGTVGILSSSLDIPYKAFINVSTSSVLLDHETFYSATKASAERLCRAFAHEYNKPIVTLRPFSLYGIGEADFRFIPTVFRSCLENELMDLIPDAVHDWVYVDDFVEVMIKYVLYEGDLRGIIANLGTGIGTTNRNVVKLIEEITGKKANIKGERKFRSFDNKDWKAETIEPNVTSLEDGLKKIYNDILRRREVN